MNTLAFCRKNGLAIKNHGIGTHSDKTSADGAKQSTLKHLKTYSADLLNPPQYLGYSKKSLIGCPYSVVAGMLVEEKKGSQSWKEDGWISPLTATTQIPGFQIVPAMILLSSWRIWLFRGRRIQSAQPSSMIGGGAR
jgi:hypothetical protein